ncbi:MAG TPA: class I SAM-dependent methyltransferase [bacterium]|nr:class I SAM-dependent methyltransferase [bacterium]
MRTEPPEILYRLLGVIEKLRLLRLTYRLYLLLEQYAPHNLWRTIRRDKIAPDGILFPPPRLRTTVAGKSDPSWWFGSGELSARDILGTLAENGFYIGSGWKVLDFGCGAGRVIRHLWSVARADLYGTDSNPMLVDWCDRVLKFAQFTLSQPTPPLMYPASYFDVIYAISVLTHLPEEDQLSWMREFSRVLRPGGLLLITTHGECYLGRLNGEDKKRFMDGKMVIRRPAYAGSNLCTAFHPEEYVRHTLSKGFEMIDWVSGGAKGTPRQDIFLLRENHTQL